MVRARWTAALVALAFVSAACGTRRADEDFLANRGGFVVGEDGAPVDIDGDGVIEPDEIDATSAPGATSGPSAGTDLGSVDPGSSGGPGGPSAGPSGGPIVPGEKNTASDIGVTATQITIGNIVSRGGIFGPDQFTPNFYGASAFFQDLNARGGVNGRTVRFVSRDDGGDPAKNQQVARDLVEKEKSFALVANNIFDYSGAEYVNSKGVPDIGGQPIGTHYDTYPHLYSIYGSQYPRDGKVGFKGKLYGNFEEYRFYKLKYGIKRAAVVYYDQAASSRYGKGIADFLRAEGYEFVREYPMALGLPNFDSAVADMKENGIEGVWDAMDKSGNANFCDAMNSAGYRPKVKSSQLSSWTETVRDDYNPPCRDFTFTVSRSRPYHETGHPEVARFRAAMKRYYASREPKMHQWALEGWAAAMWLTDAIASCGAKVTRVCVEAYMNQPKEKWYNARGLLTPRDFKKVNYDVDKTDRDCISVVQYQQTKWVTRGFLDRDCYETPYRGYDP